MRPHPLVPAPLAGVLPRLAAVAGRARRAALVGVPAAVTALLGVRAPVAGAETVAEAMARAEAVSAAVQEPVGTDAVTARPGDLLVVRELEGRLTVRAGTGDAVRVVPESPGDGAVVPTRSGTRILLGPRDERRRSRQRDVVVEVPRWLPLDVRADELRVRVEGLGSDVTVRTVEGDVDVRSVEGVLSLWTVDGEIRATDVRGRVFARSVDESVELRRVSGDVEAGSTDGDLRLVDVDAARVDAQTVDGDITFEGRLRPGGTYALVTHGGDVTAAVQEGVGVRVEVSTFDGSFEAGFPVTLERFRGGREMSFTLGDGAARLVLQAFDGDIRLRHLR